MIWECDMHNSWEWAEFSPVKMLYRNKCLFKSTKCSVFCCLVKNGTWVYFRPKKVQSDERRTTREWLAPIKAFWTKWPIGDDMAMIYLRSSLLHLIMSLSNNLLKLYRKESKRAKTHWSVIVFDDYITFARHAANSNVSTSPKGSAAKRLSARVAHRDTFSRRQWLPVAPMLLRRDSRLVDWWFDWAA